MCGQGFIRSFSYIWTSWELFDRVNSFFFMCAPFSSAIFHLSLTLSNNFLPFYQNKEANFPRILKKFPMQKIIRAWLKN